MDACCNNTFSNRYMKIHRNIAFINMFTNHNFVKCCEVCNLKGMPSGTFITKLCKSAGPVF